MRNANRALTTAAKTILVIARQTPENHPRATTSGRERSIFLLLQFLLSDKKRHGRNEGRSRDTVNFYAGGAKSNQQPIRN